MTKHPPEEFERIAKAYSAFQHQRDTAHPKAVSEAREQGKPVPPPPVQPRLRCHDCPGALHHGMIRPLEPFRFRGVIWYQGESNAGHPPCLERDGRSDTNDAIPYIVVARLTTTLKRKAAGLVQWTPIDANYAWARFSLELHGWPAPREFFAIRERVRDTKGAVGRRLIDVEGYTFRVFVTNRQGDAAELWRDYQQWRPSKSRTQNPWALM